MTIHEIFMMLIGLGIGMAVVGIVCAIIRALRKPKESKEGQFMKTVVICTLCAQPVFAAIFVILQLTTGLDPAPYLSYLAVPGAVELVITASLEGIKRFREEPK